MSDDHHGADRVADFLDKPLPEGGTHRKRVATMARAYPRAYLMPRHRANGGRVGA